MHVVLFSLIQGIVALTVLDSVELVDSFIQLEIVCLDLFWGDITSEDGLSFQGTIVEVDIALAVLEDLRLYILAQLNELASSHGRLILHLLNELLGSRPSIADSSFR